jgi:hypothetical protein
MKKDTNFVKNRKRPEGTFNLAFNSGYINHWSGIMGK